MGAKLRGELKPFRPSERIIWSENPYSVVLSYLEWKESLPDFVGQLRCAQAVGRLEIVGFLTYLNLLASLRDKRSDILVSVKTEVSLSERLDYISWICIGLATFKRSEDWRVLDRKAMKDLCDSIAGKIKQFEKNKIFDNKSLIFWVE